MISRFDRISQILEVETSKNGTVLGNFTNQIFWSSNTSANAQILPSGTLNVHGSLISRMSMQYLDLTLLDHTLQFEKDVDDASLDAVEEFVLSLQSSVPADVFDPSDIFLKLTVSGCAWNS